MGKCARAKRETQKNVVYEYIYEDEEEEVKPEPKQVPKPLAPGEHVEPQLQGLPERAKRSIHSEAYVRYIDVANNDSSDMSDWDKQIRANSELMVFPEEARLPAEWLVNNSENGNFQNPSLDALWGVRDYLSNEPTQTMTRIVQIDNL